MTQRDLNRAVARVTGESIHEIARRGFIPLTATPIEHEPRLSAVDWEELDRRPNVFLPQRRRTATPY